MCLWARSAQNFVRKEGIFIKITSTKLTCGWGILRHGSMWDTQCAAWKCSFWSSITQIYLNPRIADWAQ